MEINERIMETLLSLSLLLLVPSLLHVGSGRKRLSGITKWNFRRMMKKKKSIFPISFICLMEVRVSE